MSFGFLLGVDDAAVVGVGNVCCCGCWLNSCCVIESWLIFVICDVKIWPNGNWPICVEYSLCCVFVLKVVDELIVVFSFNGMCFLAGCLTSFLSSLYSRSFESRHLSNIQTSPTVSSTLHVSYLVKLLTKIVHFTRIDCRSRSKTDCILILCEYLTAYMFKKLLCYYIRIIINHHIGSK